MLKTMNHSCVSNHHKKSKKYGQKKTPGDAAAEARKIRKAAENKKCYRCGGRGHMSSVCTNPPQQVLL